MKMSIFPFACREIMHKQSGSQGNIIRYDDYIFMRGTKGDLFIRIEDKNVFASGSPTAASLLYLENPYSKNH